MAHALQTVTCPLGHADKEMAVTTRGLLRVPSLTHNPQAFPQLPPPQKPHQALRLTSHFLPIHGEDYDIFAPGLPGPQELQKMSKQFLTDD